MMNTLPLLQAGGQSFRVASPAALEYYRREHQHVAAAYRQYMIAAAGEQSPESAS